MAGWTGVALTSSVDLTGLIGVETTVHSLGTNVNGTFVVQFDTTNLANGDTLEAKIYAEVEAGATFPEMWRANYAHAQIVNNKCSPMIIMGSSQMAFTLNQKTGTGRVYKFKVLQQ